LITKEKILAIAKETILSESKAISKLSELLTDDLADCVVDL
jgi:arabinose-5-phosphate isomerase